MNDYPSRVTLFEEGFYRWSYYMDMWHNRFMLRVVMRVLWAMCLLLSLTMLAAFGPDNLRSRSIAALFLIPAGSLSLLTLLIYLICALVMRGNYHLRFEMDENTVMLVQSTSTKQRNRIMASIATFIGVLAGLRNKAYRVGATLNAADSVGTTVLSDITSVRLYPKDDVIALREWFGLNQIYVPREDYAFVRDFVLEHSPRKARDRSKM